MNFDYFLNSFIDFKGFECILTCLGGFRHVLEAYVDLLKRLSCLPGRFAPGPINLLRYVFLTSRKSDFGTITLVFHESMKRMVP